MYFNQLEKYGPDAFKPVYDDILLIKLVPGQTINVECNAVNGIGVTHAKWSPVSTAYYRMMPLVNFTEPITGKDAKDLKERCPMNVFDIEDTGKAVATRPINCTMCRECLRETTYKDKIILSREPEHYIFTIESVGQIPAPELFIRALEVLENKCDKIDEQYS